MATIRQTLEQERAASAWKDVQSVPASQQDKYDTLARKLPTMIQMNGLGTTLAFLLAKGKLKADDGHTMIFNHISEWVLSKVKAPQNHPNLMIFVHQVDMPTYRRATAEAIEYAIWLKRYVEAMNWGGSASGTGNTSSGGQGINP